jgi:hypothetical protein
LARVPPAAKGGIAQEGGVVWIPSSTTIDDGVAGLVHDRHAAGIEGAKGRQHLLPVFRRLIDLFGQVRREFIPFTSWVG